MTVTCGLRTLIVSAALSGGLYAQSLEDKVSQIRRGKTPSVLEMDQKTLDSLLHERALIDSRTGERGTRLRAAAGPDTVPRADSMLAGPISPEEDEGLLDTLEADSQTGEYYKPRRASLDRRKRPAPPIKRYEQRIFRSANPSAFSSAHGAAGRDHVLGPGDEVSVFIWGDKEREYPLTLNLEGKVFFEGVGLVPLAGLSLEEAAKRLRDRLSRIYSGIGRGTTQVDITLGRSGPIKAFILGEVKVPGGYVFTGNTSVLSGLYFARGPSDIGSVRSLRLSRGGRKHVLDLYQYLMRGENLSPASLQDGDILFAPRAEILAEIQGDVGRPAVYELKRGEGIKELLQFSGGPNATAAEQRMTLQRMLPGGRVEYRDLESPRAYLEGKASVELADGDRVLVHKSSELPGGYMTVSGPVKYPGTYSAEGVRTVTDLVAKAGGLREDAFLGRVHVVRFRADGSSMLHAYSLDSALADTISLQAKDDVILYSTREMYLPDSVEIAGAVFNPGRYEFREGMSAKDLVMQAGGFLPNHERGKLLVFRGDVREPKVEQIDMEVSGGLAKTRDNFLLRPRDFVQVPEDPRWYRKEIVTLSGLFVRPGKYSLLHPGEKLSSLVERAGGFKSNAYVEGGRFYRSRDSVGRMGVDIRKALDTPRGRANIALLGGDSLYIPARLNTVKVIGEVGFETSVIYSEGAPVQYYVEKAGGFTRRSERDRVVVQYANGETSRDGFFNRKPDAGSVIYVPQGPEPKPVDFFGGLNAVLGTLGVTTAVILSIQAISGK